MEKQTPAQKLYATEDIIEALTQANMGHAPAQHRHIFREALRALVMLAKAEKLFEIKRDTALALGVQYNRPSPN